jgi:Uma2 family endonuclease
MVPDLAIEVLSPSNTPGEMKRKLDEYFDVGVRIVWLVDGRSRTIRIHESPTTFTTFGTGDTVSGGDALPGFVLTVDNLFAELDRKATN